VPRTNIVCGTYLFKYDRTVTSRNDAQSPAPLVPAGADPGLVDAIAQLSFLVQNALAEVAGEDDLSPIQTRLLGVLRDREPTMNELGRHLGLDKSSITGLVSRAQRRGLLARTVSEIDRRVVRVSITDAGRDLVERVAERFAERVEDLVGVLAASDRQDFSRLASRIVLADMRRHGLDPGDAAG
jgi:MarR family transcriptional regulator, lower aerobic nicotinate degradation pathway regulator